jgi:flagellin
MSLNVNFNPAATRTHLNLRATDRMLSQSLERLSTGLRINSAQDDPAGLVIANAIRATVTGLATASENAETGITMMQTAEGSMDQISGLLLKVRELVLGAANDGANDTAQYTAYQTELNEAVNSITRIAEQTSFGSRRLLQGTLSGLTLDQSAKDNLAQASWDARRLPGGIQEGSAVTIAPPDRVGGSGITDGVAVTFAGSPPGTTPIQGLTQGATVLDAVAGTGITLLGPVGNGTYALDATTSIDDLVAAINADTQTTGAYATYAAGVLQVANVQPASGALSVVSQEMTSGALGVGLLDPALASAANPARLTSDNLVHQRISVQLRSAGGAVPTASSTLNGLSQEGGAALAIGAGAAVVLTGPRGTQTVQLSASTRIDQFLAEVNGRTALTGVRAIYDSVGGVLSLENLHFGSGAVAASSTDLTGGGVGLLDGDTTDALANPFAESRDVFTMSFAHPGGGAATAQDKIFGLQGDGATFDVVWDDEEDKGGQLTVFGKGTQATLELRAPTLPDDVGAWVAANTVNTHWDQGTRTFSVQTDLAGVVTPVASLVMTDSTTYQQFAAFLSGTAPVNAAVPAALGVTAGVVNGAVVLTPGAAPVPASATAAADSFAAAAWLGSNVPHVRWVQEGPLSGTLAVVDDSQPDPQPVASGLVVDAATTPGQMAAWLNQTPHQDVTRATITMTPNPGPAAYPTDITATFAAAPGATLALEGTSLGDVVAFINNQAEELGISASFIAAAGLTPAAIRVTGTAGSINIQSDRLSSAANTGLLDRDTTDPLSSGGTQVSAAPNPTLDLSFTDAQGIARRVRLTQIPTTAGGLTFANLNAGPESGPPFTGWQAGAFSVTVQDPSALAPGAVITIPTRDLTASRTSDIRIQTGPEAGQNVVVEVPDMRAEALGWSSMRTRLASATTDDVAFLRRGLYTLADLVDRRALLNGWHQEALTVVDAAIDEITVARGRLGATQADSVESILQSQRVQELNLSEAESRIRDVDFGLESAEYSRTSILYQAGIAMLAQANQVPQSVLQLLR